MPEGERSFVPKHDQAPNCTWISTEFIEAVPVDSGMDTFMKYLDHNLQKDIEREVTEYAPPNLREYQKRIIPQVLWRYADTVHMHLGAKEQGDDNLAERLDYKRLGMRRILHDLGLGYEVEVLEYLFEQAALLAPRSLRRG